MISYHSSGKVNQVFSNYEILLSMFICKNRATNHVDRMPVVNGSSIRTLASIVATMVTAYKDITSYYQIPVQKINTIQHKKLIKGSGVG